jgi:uncharacterized protein
LQEANVKEHRQISSATTGMHRRQFLKTSAAAGATAVAFSSLAARGAAAQFRAPFSRDYGPLAPVKDQATGLHLLSLPKGFEYASYGWTGMIMADGRPTPTDHDGMAVVGQRGRTLALVRNHEQAGAASLACVVEGGMYNANEGGGTTNVYFDLLRGRFSSSYTSLGGTIRNCAGGPTPWGSWVTCEETFHTWNGREDGFNHGYVFDVPGFGISPGQPVRAAGRFSHEAVAIDPWTGVMYETEDTGSSGFYKYVQPGAGKPTWWRGRERGELLRDGGELYAMVVDGASRKDLRGGFTRGDSFAVSWQLVQDPEGMSGSAFASAPDAAIFARGEGCWYDDGKIYFISTSGGAAGLGQVWVYDPRRETVTMLYESPTSEALDSPDNIAISPRGGIVLCEDGDHDPQRLIGLDSHGEVFTFAENLIDLAPGDIDQIDAVFPGTKQHFTDDHVGVYTDQEWAGATFYGPWLFVNIQTPGVTFAITGPWRKGSL